MPDPKVYVSQRAELAKAGIEESMGKDFLAELERLFLISRQVLAGKLRAERRTKKRGSGLEFAEHREYNMGDDFRHIDWNLYGRLEKLFVRLYEEEEDIPVYVMFDVSASMLEGTPIKAVHAFRIAASLAYVALAHLDRATMLPFTAAMEQLQPPGRGKGRMFKMFHNIRNARLGGVTDLVQATRSFVFRRPRRGQVILISDFLTAEGYEEAINLLRYHRYRVIVVQVLSPQEIAPKLSGDLELMDVETGQTRSITVTANLLRAYMAELQKYTDGLRTFCQDHAIPYFLSPTDQPLETLMLDVFRKGGFLK